MRDDQQFESDEPATSEAEATRHELVLDVDADAAWELLGSSDGLERWLGDDVDLEVTAGEHGTIRDGDELLLTEVESVEMGRRVSLRWWSEERGAAVVDLTLEPLGDCATRLVVVEIPVDALRIPVSPATLGGAIGDGAGPQMIAGGWSGGPQMLAGSQLGGGSPQMLAGARTLALA